jgi:hypothetical protein
MTTLYYLSATNSDLSGGADFNKKLVASGETSGSQTLSFGNSESRTSYGFTEPGNPSVLGKTGNYTITVNIPTTNAQGRLAISLSRVNSAGTAQSTSSSTSEQTTNSATLTFSLTSINLGTWSPGDRLRVNYEFRNNSTMAQSWAIGYGTVSSALAPWIIFDPPTFKYWDGDSWEEGNLYRYNGDFWIPALVKRWDGTNWVIVP